MSRVDRVLLVEDDIGLQKQVRWALDRWEVVAASDREAALASVRRFEPAVVILDLGLPPYPDAASEGLAALEEILLVAPTTKVIVVTGNEEHKNAVRAIGLGAYDFYQKPFDPETLALIVERAFRLHDLEQENRRLAAQTADASPMSGLITNDPEMLKLCRTVEKVALSDATVLLLGESGTGKEVLARALHASSARAAKRFVAINCAAIPDTLLESELFGYEKGAFTGAVKQTIGRIEYADGGTLFLDEIGDLPSALQAKLLRFLQERVIERLGARGEVPVNVRVVCATHQDLARHMHAGTFRADLYYRISEISLAIPPLRARGGDALLLAHAFLDRLGRVQPRAPRGFAREALAAIEKHGWPGNVRELENVVKRAVIMAEGQQISAADLGLNPSDQEALPLNLRRAREEAEKKAVIRAMSRANSNIAQAADLLGVSRPTLYDLINRYGLK